MKFILLFTLPLALLAQETTPPPAPPPAQAATLTNSRSTIVIEAKARSEDIVRAYELLKREKPTLHISAHTFSGQTLSNIVDITAMPNGTMLLFRLTSTQGAKLQFVLVDDVLDLFYS